MRITQAAREETRQRILDVASDLFQGGYAGVTTRAIARGAKIAAGTLFNYFPSKEALGFTLVDAASTEALAAFDASPEPEPLEERLFAHVAIQLRYLAPMRSWTPEVLESALSPLRVDRDDAAGEFRQRHLQRVHDWIATELGHTTDRSMDLHLYWSLYLGVLSFWASDESENQAATLALLDRSMRLFCRTLTEDIL